MTYFDKFVILLTQRQGQTAREINAQIDLDAAAVGRELSRLVCRARLFQIDATPAMRYFTSPEAREAMRAQVQIDSAGHLELKKLEARVRSRDFHRRSYEVIKAANALLPKKPRKQCSKPKAPKQTLRQPRPIPAKTALQAWKTAEAIIPAGLRVQRIPCGIDTRYTATGRVVGGFATLGIGRYLGAECVAAKGAT